MTTWSGSDDGDESSWLLPSEVLKWSGRPGRSPFFSKEDWRVVAPLLFLLLASLLAGNPIFPGVVKIAFSPFLLVLVFGRLASRRFLLRRTRYAITNFRCVELRNGEPLVKVPLGLEFTLDRSVKYNRTTIRFVSKSGSSRSLKDLLFSTSILLNVGAKRQCIFYNLAEDSAEEAVAVLSVDSASAPAHPSDEAVSATPRGVAQPISSLRFRKDHEKFVLWWIRTRLLKQPYILRTSFSDSEVNTVLRNIVSPWRLAAVFGGGQGALIGRVQPSGATFRARSSGQNNSWRWIFEGHVQQIESGSVLVGSVGPNRFTPVFSAIWTAPFFIFGAIIIGTFLSRLVQFQLSKLFLGAQFALIPLGSLSFYFALTEFASRSAAKEWGEIDVLLRTVLHAERPE